MLRTVIYCRVSTEQQAQDGDSIEAQLAACKQYINSREDCILTDTFVDAGVSGQKLKRDELMELLSKVRKNEVDLIVFTKLDRWFRSSINFLNTQEILKEHRCQWVAIQEPHYNMNTPQGQMLTQIIMSVAELEAKNAGQRVRMTFDHKVQKGEVLSGNTPLGYRIENKHLIIDEENAVLVRRAFEIFDQTEKYVKVHAFLLENNQRRSFTCIKKMLGEKKYIGVFRGNTNYCPPIVPEELFFSVQSKIKTGVRSTRKRCYVFSGLILCSECGCRMPGQARSNGSKFYRCPRHFVYKECGNFKSYTETVLEKQLVKKLKPAIQDYIVNCKIKNQPIADNSKKITALENKKRRLIDLYTEELIDINEFKMRKEVIETELKKLEQQLPAREVDTSKLEQILNMDLETTYFKLSDEEKRFFWKSVVKKIVADSQKNLTLFFD